MVTIKMIAQRCGLSTAAVSRALNNLSGVSRENAERVRQAAREMGYHPNEAARTLKTNRSNLIGVLYNNEMAHEFFAQVLEGLRTELEGAGYDVLFLSPSSGDYTERARKHHCAGVVIAQGDFDPVNVDKLICSELPVVRIEAQTLVCPSVFSDNVRAMEEIVHYLHDEMGHSRIAFIHGEMGTTTQERIAGFYRGCHDCGIAVPEEYLRAARFRTPYVSGDVTRELLALPKPPSCILYPDDISCLGGMSEIERQGLRIPEDVSCVGFDGISLTQLLKPRMTTYFQDGRTMGRTAAQEIISAIVNPRGYVPRTISIAGRLQPGGTVRCLKGETDP